MKAKITNTLVKSLEPGEKIYSVWDTEIKGFILKVSPSGEMVYYLDYRTKDGRRKSYRIGSLKPAQAREVAELRAADVAHGKDIQEEKKEARAKVEKDKLRTLRAFIDNRYAAHICTHHKRPEDTLGKLDSKFSYLMHRPMTEITPWVIEKWRAEQKKAGKADATVNRCLMTLKACLSQAVKWGLLDANPLASVKPLKIDSKGRVRYLSEDEEKRLVKALDERERRIRIERASANQWRRERGYEELPDLWKATYADYLKPMCLLARHTGMRVGEIFNLRWQDVNFHTKLLTVRGSTAKSGQTRHIPMNEEVQSVLKAWCDQQEDTSGLVFPGKQGKPFNNIQSSWEVARKAAKLEDFRWHDFRHDFASKLVMRGVDLNTVRELLGHADLKMTLRYAHLAPEHLESAVAKLCASN